MSYTTFCFAWMLFQARKVHEGARSAREASA